MSRKLDDGALTSIRIGDNEAAFSDIAASFASAPKEGLWEIELLGKSHPLPEACNVLVDGESIAIPKVKLVQAFVFARKRFSSCNGVLEKHWNDILKVTTVMLLMDPEHLTAANARKRAIKSLESVSTTAELEVALKRESVYIDSILTSPLHRHSKSPTLWSHRRWLHTVRRSIQIPCNIQQDLINVVMVAAERHPRNYYAWLHMRWILETFAGVGCTNRVISGYQPVQLDCQSVLLAVRDWCLRHPSDTSGWSFLLFVLFARRYSEDTASMFCPLHMQSSIFEEVLGFARSFKWTHESVWVFLRSFVGFGRVTDEDRRVFVEAKEALPVLRTRSFLVD